MGEVINTEQYKDRKTRRNKQKVRYDLLDAVGKTLKERGFNQLGINTVAEMAGTDKNAIYRHFGSFEQLLDQYLEKQDFWLKSLSTYKDTKVENHKQFIKDLLLGQYETINRNKELQQLLIWELGELSQRTKSLSQRREQLSEAILKQYESHFQGEMDFNVMMSIIIAGIYYLILHKEHSTFCLVDFKNEKDRIHKGIDQLIEIIFQARDNLQIKEQIAINAIKNGLDTQTVSKITELSLSRVEDLKVKCNK
jgi:AcrR family transcriptional regulator